MTSCTHWHEMTKDEILIIFCYFFHNEKSRVFEDKSLGVVMVSKRRMAIRRE